MVRNTGQMYITGPQVIKEVTGEEINGETLGQLRSTRKIVFYTICFLC
jgi:acetyl-CoA carboxylase carboxyltransferase component